MQGIAYYRTLVSMADLWQLPLILILLFAMTSWLINGQQTPAAIRKYAFPALALRLLAAVLALIMYQYYYGYGDTYGYFYCGRQIWTALWEAPLAGLELLFFSPEEYSALARSYADHAHFSSRDSRFVAQVIGVLSLFTFKSYLSISFLLSFLSFIGCWKIFRVFQALYPQLHRPLAVAILFVPSVVFWGIGLMKESILLFGLGLLIEGLFAMIYFRRGFFGKNILYCILGGFILFKVKPYILLAGLVAFTPIVIQALVRRCRGVLFQFFSKSGLYLMVIALAFSAVFALGQLIKVYNPVTALNYLSLVQKTQIAANATMGGSGYDIGIIEPNFQSLVAKSGAAINVTLFRPYPWESKKIINFPAMVESLLTLLLTILVFFRVGPIQTIKRILTNPIILFCLLFTLSIGMIVGLFAFNFGTLVRYKIPVLPFYYIALILLWYNKGDTRVVEQGLNVE